MNVYLEHNLMKAHQEEILHEVRMNRLAKRIKRERAPSLGTAKLLWPSFRGLRRVLLGQIGS